MRGSIAFILGPLASDLVPKELAAFYRGIYDKNLKTNQVRVIKEMREALGDEDADEEYTTTMSMLDRQANLLRKLGLTHFLPETSSKKIIPCSVEGCRKMFRTLDDRDKHAKAAHKEVKRPLAGLEERPESEKMHQHLNEVTPPLPAPPELKRPLDGAEERPDSETKRPRLDPVQSPIPAPTPAPSFPAPLPSSVEEEKDAEKSD